MTETFDVIDINRDSLHKTVRRGIDPLGDNEYHLAVDVVFVNHEKKLLLQKRAACKKSYPNFWGPTGGAVQAGESALQGLIRECEEEIGIAPELQNTLATFCNVCHHTIIETRLILQEINLADLHFQEIEVCAADWLNICEVEKLLKNDQILPSTIPAVRQAVEFIKTKF